MRPRRRARDRRRGCGSCRRRRRQRAPACPGGCARAAAGSRVDSGHAQNRRARRRCRPPTRAGDPRRRRAGARVASARGAARLGHARTRAITVHTRRRDVDETLRYNSRPRERRDQSSCARIIAAVGRRRREVQNAERRGAQASQRCAAIEVADDGHDAVHAELRRFVAAARETVEPGAALEQRRGAQRNVTATDQQNPDHDRGARVSRAGSMHITITPSDHSFPCEADETVLQAAMRADLMIPYGCRNGACGTCKGKIVSGTVDYGPYQKTTLSEDEKQVGLALFCCARPADRSRDRGARSAPRRRHPDPPAAVPDRVDRQARRPTSRSCASSCPRTSGCSSSPASTSISC